MLYYDVLCYVCYFMLHSSHAGGCLVAAPGQAIEDCDNQTDILLDSAAEIGVYVMVDLAAPFREIVCGSIPPSSKDCPAMRSSQRGDDEKGNDNKLTVQLNVEAGWRAVEAAVKRYANHRALLGWYVCDDCMTSWIVAQRAAGTATVDTLCVCTHHTDLRCCCCFPCN